MKKLAIIVVAGVGFTACQELGSMQAGESDPPSQEPLIGGAFESGWPAVGALAHWAPGWGFAGSFCTGTLIAPKWVLTAAHCVTSDGGGGAQFTPTPSTTLFYVGTDATYTGSSGPNSGSAYTVSAFYVHPNWDPQHVGSGYDIALVQLAAPLNSVTPIPYATTSNLNSGQSVFYVGFGVNSEANGGTGSGYKRSAYLDVLSVGNITYASSANNPAVCYGDSGGPGLRQIGGAWTVVGVNSYVTGGGCVGSYSVQTRVDAFGGWIASTISGAPSNCQTDPSLCFCPEACLQNGNCDNSKCQTLSCWGLSDCINNCGDSVCAVDCYNQGTVEAQTQFNDMQDCFALKCGGLSGPAFQTCAGTYCEAEIDTCYGVGSGTATCSETYDCLVACPNDSACYNNCYSSASSLAVSQLEAMFDCWNDKCPGGATNACIEQNCQQQSRTCLGSGSNTEGQQCGWFLDCAAGLTCAVTGLTTTCRRPCDFSAPSCPGGQVCLESGLCDPPGAPPCACDITTNVLDPSCACDPVYNPSCACDQTYGCDTDSNGRECYCDKSCADYCPCNFNPGCASGCGCDTDCPCVCDTDDKCDPSCACDLDCYVGCSCDTSTSCDANCACDPECSSTCSCNITSGCDTGCACDDDCNQVCACDISDTCDQIDPTTPCSCDSDCGNPCACDLTAGCDDGCACDPICAQGCACDVTPGTCDPGCACDTECCLCDVTPLCDGGCACDPKCDNSCACDITPLCDGGCACDPKCDNSCACDITPLCDGGCACDPKCGGTGGSGAGSGNSAGTGNTTGTGNSSGTGNTTGTGNNTGTAGTAGDGGEGGAGGTGGAVVGGGCASTQPTAGAGLLLLALVGLRRRRRHV